MKKTRFSEEQMVKILLREADSSPVAEVAKKHGVSEATIYAWRKRFGALEALDVKRLRALEAESAKLKKLGYPDFSVVQTAFRCRYVDFLNRIILWVEVRTVSQPHRDQRPCATATSQGRCAAKVNFLSKR